MSENIDPVFAKTRQKRSFSLSENERFGLVFAGHRLDSMRVENQNGAFVDHVFCSGAVQRLRDSERGRCCLLQSQAEAADYEKLISCSVQISIIRSLITF